MKGLAWYSVVILVWACLALFVSLATGASADPATDIWAIFLNVPMVVFFVLFLKKAQDRRKNHALRRRCIGQDETLLNLVRNN